MRRILVALWAFTLGLTTLGPPPAAAAAVESIPAFRPTRSCSGLQGMSYEIPGAEVHITAADGSDSTTCDVHATVDPHVRFELKLPISAFTGRYVQYGCQGECGAIFPPPPACSPLPGGNFATASTDDGHMGDPNNPIFDASWAANNQAARNDYFYRAPHVVALAAKQLIAIYYGAPPQRSYFVGCSTGGREALLLAQRYPYDFNGIVAGDPTNYLGPLLGAYMTWIVRANTNASGKPILTADKLPAVHNAVLSACDSLDGLADGQIDDPTVCHIDPGTLQCPVGTDQPSCLTAVQVDVVRKL